MNHKAAKKFIYLSIAAAVITICLKFYAYFLTRSMGFFSDALESFVNLIAAVVALIMLNISAKPADDEHEFGHTKAEYFSSAIEGALIFVASLSIIYSSVPKLWNPTTLENINIGLIVSLSASIVNLVVGQILIRNGKKMKSLVLEADGKHLMTDVWTSVGVILAIILVKITGWLILDPIIAIAVALNIIFTGYNLILRSANGLMDKSIDDTEIKQITDYLDTYHDQNIDYHSFKTRQSGQRKFISFHLLMPGDLTVKEGHDKADEIEDYIENMFPEPVMVSTHIEPIEDPASLKVEEIDRSRKKS